MTELLFSSTPTDTLAPRPESWIEWFQDLRPLLSADDTWTLWAIILVGVALSIYLEQTYRWAAKLSGPVLCLVAAMLLTNLKIMPADAPAYALVHEYLVPIAIPLLLFRANIFHIVRTTGSMFVAFHVSVLGTILGAALVAALFINAFDQVPAVTGIMTGSYTGGAVNFFAVKNSFDVSDNLTSPLLVADNFIMAGMFIALLGIAGSTFFRRHYPHPHSMAEDTEESQSLAAQYWKPKEVSLLDLAKALAVALVIAAVSSKLSAWIKPQADQAEGPQIALFAREIIGNQFVLITFFSVLAATLLRGRLEKVGGAEELGAYLLYIFFFVIGLPADLVTVVLNVPMMFLFCLVIALVNLAVTLSLGKLLRLNLEDLVLCVNATLGGAPSAAAMAIAKGWPKLVLPSLLVGIWGYVIGTFLGILVGKMLSLWF
ncbi:MAG: DUF819 family protein [Planctomycetota bacterium]|jgi:uncharacterized membrane protein